jgi:hypothetical protein
MENCGDPDFDVSLAIDRAIGFIARVALMLPDQLLGMRLGACMPKPSI